MYFSPLKQLEMAGTIAKQKQQQNNKNPNNNNNNKHKIWPRQKEERICSKYQVKKWSKISSCLKVAYQARIFVPIGVTALTPSTASELLGWPALAHPGEAGGCHTNWCLPSYWPWTFCNSFTIFFPASVQEWAAVPQSNVSKHLSWPWWKGGQFLTSCYQKSSVSCC